MCKLAKYVRNCVVFWKNLHSWQKFYTTAGRDGRDKFQVCPRPFFSFSSYHVYFVHVLAMTRFRFLGFKKASRKIAYVLDWKGKRNYFLKLASICIFVHLHHEGNHNVPFCDRHLLRDWAKEQIIGISKVNEHHECIVTFHYRFGSLDHIATIFI